MVLTWAPHPRALPQAVPNSFADWMNEADVDFVITHPEGYELDPKFVRGAKVEYNQMKAFEGADFIYAKNWACPGVTHPADYGKILSKDMSWTVDAAHMAVTNNAFFMHCLPVRRNMIVTDEVIEAPTSLVIPGSGQPGNFCYSCFKENAGRVGITGSRNDVFFLFYLSFHLCDETVSPM